MKKLLSILVIVCVFILSSCGGGGGTSTVTVSGVATDDPISNGNVSLQLLDGTVIATTNTDANGNFKFPDLNKSTLQQGYELVVTGGQVSGAAFSGELRARYSSADDEGSANVTLITTLVSKLIAQETTGTPLEKRDAVIQRLVDMGVVKAGEWKAISPAGVNLAALRTDISNQTFDTVMGNVAVDLQDEDVSPESMRYFYNAHGGVISMELSKGNVISLFPGATGSSSIITLENDNAATYTFKKVSGPTWITLSQTGSFDYTVPANVLARSEFPVTIRLTNSSTGFGRLLHAKIHVMKASVIGQGTINPNGNIITDDSGDIVIIAPAGAVTSNTPVKITRGRDANGRVVLEIDPQGTLKKPLELRLPAPDVFDANTPVNTAQPQSVITGIQLKRNSFKALATTQSGVIPEFGSEKCVEKEDNATIMSHCWNVEASYVINSFTTFHRLPNGSNSYKLIDKSAVSYEPVSQLWSAVSASDLSLSTKDPVLFVHGFNQGKTFGGGEGTWGDFESLITQYRDAYIPFEFQWRTGARFQDVADDLGYAIQLIELKTHKKVHVIAHSFGGVLARVLLQGLSSSRIDVEIASLTTVGTPHSGIYDTTTIVASGRTFPDGQDSLVFNACEQISCYQMGEMVFFSRVSNNSLLGIDNNKGFITKNLANTSSNPLPANLPIQVLIGGVVDLACENPLEPYNPLAKYNPDAPYGIYSNSCTAPLIPYLGSGDDLISYDGQRFHPGVVGKALANQSSSYGAIVTEKLLGFDDTLLPGKLITESTRDSGVLSKDGFCHTGSSCSARLRFGENLLNEVDIKCDTLSSGRPCQHPTWIETKNFLDSITTTSATIPMFTVNVAVKDAAGNAVSGARVEFSANNSSLNILGNNVSDVNGNVSVDIPFYSFTPYRTRVIPPSGFKASSSNASLETSLTIASSNKTFPPITLAPAGTSSASLSQGLVAYYPLDNNSNDVSGNGNDAVAFGAPTFTTGVKGQAASFDGTSYFRKSNFNLSTNDFTVSLWLRAKDVPAWYRMPFAVHSGGGGNALGDKGIRMFYFTPGYYLASSVATDGAVAQAVVRSNTVSALNWHHVAFTRKGKIESIYIDGSLSATAINVSSQLSILNGFLEVGAPNYYNGGWIDNGRGTAKWQGEIDEFRLYNRALTNTEIKQLSN